MNEFPTRAQINAADPLPFDGVKRGDDPSLTENASAKLKRKQEEGRRAAAARNAPLGTPKPAFQEEALPADLPGATPAPAEPTIAPRTLVMSVTILYRGRQITIASEGRTLDQFCDLLDSRLGVAS